MALVTIKTPNGTRFKVGTVRQRIEVRRPKGIRIFVKQYDNRFVDYLRQWIAEDIEAGEDFIIKVTGPRRKGKSTAALRIANALCPIGIENVVYTAKDFARMAETLPPSNPTENRFSIIVFDEAGYGMFKQRWYDREQQEIVRLLEVNAAKRLIVFLVSPHNDYINSAIQNPTMCKLWIDVGLAQRYGKGMASIWSGVYHQFRVQGFWNPVCCFQFDKLTGDFWEQYESQKFDFINQASRQIIKTNRSRDKLDRLLSKIEHEL